MQDLFNVSNIEARRQALRLPIGEFCRRSGVNFSTWERLRAGGEPRLSTAHAIKTTIEEEERDMLAHLVALHPDLAAALVAAKQEEAA